MQCDHFTYEKCDVAAVGNDYKELHKQVVIPNKQKEGYVCTSNCGDYGNRIQGITLALICSLFLVTELQLENYHEDLSGWSGGVVLCTSDQ